MSLTPSLNLPDAELPSVLSALQSEKQRRLTEDRLRYYKPYDLQAKFPAAGAQHRERLVCAGNQLGKTTEEGIESLIETLIAPTVSALAADIDAGPILNRRWWRWRLVRSGPI